MHKPSDHPQSSASSGSTSAARGTAVAAAAAAAEAAAEAEAEAVTDTNTDTDTDTDRHSQSYQFLTNIANGTTRLSHRAYVRSSAVFRMASALEMPQKAMSSPLTGS